MVAVSRTPVNIATTNSQMGHNGPELCQSSELHGASWFNGSGLNVEHPHEVVIENSVVTGSHAGLWVSFAPEGRIAGNTLEGNFVGIFLTDCSNLVVPDDTVQTLSGTLSTQKLSI